MIKIIPVDMVNNIRQDVNIKQLLYKHFAYNGLLTALQPDKV